MEGLLAVRANSSHNCNWSDIRTSCENPVEVSEEQKIVLDSHYVEHHGLHCTCNKTHKPHKFSAFSEVVASGPFTPI